MRPVSEARLMFNFSKLGHDLYTGEKSFDFIGKRALWYSISGASCSVRC